VLAKTRTLLAERQAAVAEDLVVRLDVVAGLALVVVVMHVQCDLGVERRDFRHRASFADFWQARVSPIPASLFKAVFYREGTLPVSAGERVVVGVEGEVRLGRNLEVRALRLSQTQTQTTAVSSSSPVHRGATPFRGNPCIATRNRSSGIRAGNRRLRVLRIAFALSPSLTLGGQKS
jgi:hypothetical protein